MPVTLNVLSYTFWYRRASSLTEFRMKGDKYLTFKQMKLPINAHYKDLEKKKQTASKQKKIWRRKK